MESRLLSRSVPRDNLEEALRFDKDAYGRFKLPHKFGEAISGIDDPSFASVDEATFMRSDDYVVGLVFDGVARAYPLWIVDNYHVVNDRVGDRRFYFTSCERCQSGAAFEAVVEGSPDREPLFRSVGFLNATLLLKDLRSGSHWLHYEGLGLDRRSAGVRLPWIPTYHMEWSDWVAMHPETEVMVPPVDPGHPDARHGHGREEMFARAGMEPAFLTTVLGELDRTYPENEMVLGFGDGDGWYAFPLAEVRREGGVVEAVSDGRAVVVLAGPGDAGFTMSAFISELDGKRLTFAREGSGFVDRQTGTRWTIAGRATEGPLQGAALEPVPWFYVRWHAWIYFHRDTTLFQSSRNRGSFPEGAQSLGGGEAAEILDVITRAGHEVVICEPLVSQRWPRQVRESYRTEIDGDPVNIHVCESVNVARDLVAYDAAWSGWPLKPRSYEGKARRIGRVVLESDPARRFEDPANIVPLPPSVVRWASILSAPVLDDLAANAEDHDEGAHTPAFVEVVRALRLARFEVIDVAFLPPSQLRVGVVNGIALTIDAERFLLYRFADPEAAGSYAAAEEHVLAVGPLALRSTPESMYLHQGAEILYAGDGTIRWSSLTEAGSLRRALESARSSNG